MSDSACNHTKDLFAADGNSTKLLGTWIAQQSTGKSGSGGRTKIVCGKCGKFYGYRMVEKGKVKT